MKLIIFNVKVKKYFSNFSVQVFEGMGYGEGELFVKKFPFPIIHFLKK